VLYQGLVHFYQSNKDKGDKQKVDHKVTLLQMDHYERDLMKIFNCNPEWPVCLFDFTAKNKNPTFIELKVSRDLNSYLYEDYFYGHNQCL
jgi:hypothetical protein